MLTPASHVLLNHAPPEFHRVWSARLAWRLRMHHYQAPPAGFWRGWLMQGGRGIGKTLTGAFDAAEHSLDNPGWRYGVVAPTLGDVRRTCYEGETGLLQVLTSGMQLPDGSTIPGMGLVEGRDFDYNRSLLSFEFGNGSVIEGYGSEKPDRLRGPQFHRLWFEELAAYRDAFRGDALQTTFNNAMLGLRLGADARYIATTTPRRVKLIVDLANRDNVTITRGTSYENLDNLAPSFREEILRYENTHLGRQELLGELIAEVEGAWWTLPMVNQANAYQPSSWGRTVVGVDPSGGADVIGIVVAAEIPDCHCTYAQHLQPHYAVIEDLSLKASPEAWASRVVGAGADVIVAEQNYGGAMVEATIRNVAPAAPYRGVSASRGKMQRAEPVAILYEQNRVHHVHPFPALEDELTTFVGGEQWSPNRLDALVWALTELSQTRQRSWAAY